MHCFKQRIIFLGLKRLLTMVALIMLQSCANSKIGRQLSESFDSPLDQASLEEQDSKINSSEPILLQVDSSSKGKKVSIENKKSQIDISSKIVKDKIKNIAFTPRPYRITIKLSGANPSAPAETVTNALRKAGVKFEVERIERVNLQDSIKVFPLDSRSKQQ